MKINWRKLFTFSVSDSKYFDDTREKIEYTGCEISKKSCMIYLPEINNHFHESDILYREKEFDRSLESLEKAYDIAGEIKEQDCLQCALFFQTIVIQSIESIHNELKNMSKGLFATHRYQPSFIKAEELLKKVKSPKEIKPTYFLIKDTSTFQPVVL